MAEATRNPKPSILNPQKRRGAQAAAEQPAVYCFLSVMQHPERVERAATRFLLVEWVYGTHETTL